MAKEIKVLVRIDAELDQRMTAAMRRLPGDQSDFVRFAIERLCSDVEAGVNILRQPQESAQTEATK